MSAPDYEDPKSKLKLRFRPMRGSAMFLSFGWAVCSIGAVGCLLLVAMDFLPGVTSSGNPIWPLAGAVAFAAAGALFYVVSNALRRLK